MEQRIKVLIIVIFAISIVFLFFCIKKVWQNAPVGQVQTATPAAEKAPQNNEPKPAIANPASQNCIFKGGNLEIKKNPGGSEYGVCTFAEGKQCEEWALYRGDCPEGGVEVTGEKDEAITFCLISGGKYGAKEKECELKSGKKCLASDYLAGNCP